MLKDNKVDIALLQETHAIDSDIRFWQSEWGGPYFGLEFNSNI